MTRKSEKNREKHSFIKTRQRWIEISQKRESVRQKIALAPFLLFLYNETNLNFSSKTNETKKSKGFPLLLSTILLFVILGLVVSLSYVTVMEQKMSQKTKSSVGAFYSSKSGIEWALNKIADKTGTISAVLIGVKTYDDGKIDCPFSGTPCSVYFLNSSGNVIPKD
jgi:hypothetical protein